MFLMSPPPWTDLFALLRYAFFLYIVLFILAIINALLRRFSFHRNVHASRSNSLTSTLSTAERLIRQYRNLIVTCAVYISAIRMSLSTFICISYVYITYIGNIPKILLISLKSIGFTLAVYICSIIITSERPIAVVTNIVSIAEVISLSSILFSKKSDWLNFAFLQAYGIMSSYFTLEPFAEVAFNLKWSQFQRQLGRRAVEFVVFIYVFACGVQLFERMGEPWSSFTASTFELTLANSFYFTVVTLFTVGYGDFVPFTLLGRLWIIFIIVFGAYLISHKISQVVEVVSDLRKGRGSFVKPEGTEHCVICGNVKWEYLKSFIEEFYQDERNIDKKLLVICDRPNWSEDIWSKFFFKNPQFRQHVVYLEGSCVSREDLIRAQVDSASAIFVLCNQHNPDPYGEDSETLKRILTIRTYTPNIPIYTMCALRDSMLQITFALEHLDENDILNEGIQRRQSLDFINNNQTNRRRLIPFENDLNDTIHPTNSNNNNNNNALHSHHSHGNGQSQNQNVTMRDFSDDDDDDDGLLVHSYDGSSDLKSEAVCMQEVEMSLLAENVFCNGLSTLLGNLILRIVPINKSTDQPWAIEYKIGSECRFEYVKLPTSLHHKKFMDIAVVMYDYGVVLTATKRFMEQKWRAITPDTVFKINTVGLIITYHSAQFLDDIMGHIAQRVSRLFDEDESETEISSSDIQPHDPNDSTPVQPAGPYHDGPPPYKRSTPFHQTSRDAPSHLFSGSYLAGDISMTYDYSPDEGNGATGDSLQSATTTVPNSSSYGGTYQQTTTSSPQQQGQWGRQLDHEQTRGQQRQEGRNLSDERGNPHRAEPLNSTMFSLSTDVMPQSVLRKKTRSRQGDMQEENGNAATRTTTTTTTAQATNEPRSSSAPPPSRSSSQIRHEDEDEDSVAKPETLRSENNLATISDNVVETRSEIDISPRSNIVDDERIGKRSVGGSGRARRQSASPDRLGRVKPMIRHDTDSEGEVDRSRLKVAPAEELISSQSVDATMKLPRRKAHHVTFPSHPVSGLSGSSTGARPRERGTGGTGSKRERIGGKGGLSINTAPSGGSRSSRRIKESNTSTSSNLFYGDEELPTKFKNHIVVCAIGEMSVMNLKYFLQRVWTKRGGNDDDTPVVAIVPVISEDDETELSTFEKKNLYLIQGNSLSVRTLKCAQFDKAAAIVILACEDKTQVEEMDAKAMFTVMTLDYLLGESSETFVCTMLDAEESMQLLRAPTHPRRKGANLGPFSEALMQSWSGRSRTVRRSEGIAGSVMTERGRGRSNENIDSNHLRRWETDQHLSQEQRSFLSNRAMSFGMLSATSALPKTMSFVGTLKNTYTNRKESITNLVTRDPHSSTVSRPNRRFGPTSRSASRVGTGALGASASFLSFANHPSDDGGGVGLSGRQQRARIGIGSERSMSYLSKFQTMGFGFEPSTISIGRGSRGVGMDDELGLNMSTIGMDANADVTDNDPAIGMDGTILGRVGKTGEGTHSRPRDESFEKQRYASGEMMISSTFMTLLIREYAMPGLTAIVRKIFGAGFGQHPKSKRAWIRAVSIPREWIESGEKGQRIYREVFERLLSLGAIAIGLYRAGDCNVRLQVEGEDAHYDDEEEYDDDDDDEDDEEDDDDDDDDDDEESVLDEVDSEGNEMVMDMSDGEGDLGSGQMGSSVGGDRMINNMESTFDNFVGAEDRRRRRRKRNRNIDIQSQGSSSASSNTERGFEIGGDVVGGEAQVFANMYASDGQRERAQLIEGRRTDSPASSSYGATASGNNGPLLRSADGRSPSSNDDEGKRGERVSISSDVIERVQRVMEMEQSQEIDDGEDEDDDDDDDDDDDVVDEEEDEFENLQKYTCENTGRQAFYREVPGGGNVLPYVYANPEPYTLVSHLDAVYVLVAPHIMLPNKW